MAEPSPPKGQGTPNCWRAQKENANHPRPHHYYDHNMGENNEAIDNQCAFMNGVEGGIAMEVMGGVVIARNFDHVKNGGAPPNPPPPHSSSQSQAHDLRPF